MRPKDITEFIKAVDASTKDNEDKVKVTMRYLRDVCDYIEDLETKVDNLQYKCETLNYKLGACVVQQIKTSRIDTLI